MDESWFSLDRADFSVDAIVLASGVMAWAGVCQQTQVHFIDGILNAEK